MKKFPILIIIPHGGYKIPIELANYTELADFDLFLSADTCANEIFSFEKETIATINTHISKLFIDQNRAPNTIIEENENDGLVKRVNSFQKNIFKEDCFPDEIAINNILKRYYNPFHDTIKKILTENNIKLIIECHTVMGIGPKNAKDSDKLRPIVTLHNLMKNKDKTIETCSMSFAKSLIEQLQKNFSNEKEISLEDPFIISKKPLNDYLIQEFSGKVPYIRIDISRSLFLNDKYFNYDYLKVDQIRLKDLKKRTWKAIEKAYTRHLS